MASSTISVTRSAAFRAASNCEPRSRLSSFATVRKFWIQEGAIPLDAGGNTILHFLAMYGNAFVIQKLVNDENGNKSTSSSIVKCEDLLGRNDKGNTPLHEAARFGRKSVVEILLRKQESLVRERNSLGETPIYVAAACGHEDVYDHLITKVNRHPEIMTRSTDNSNLLHAAIMGEHYGTLLNFHMLHVSHDSPPHLMYLRNSDGEMATDAFLRQHSEIRSEAEKAVKDVNNGLMLVVVLIGTVNNAALFTPPGGYRQDENDPKYGLPVIFTEEMCIYFMLIFLGLFTGVLPFTIMFSIQSLPFRSSDFYLDLPLRLFLAMSSLSPPDDLIITKNRTHVIGGEAAHAAPSHREQPNHQFDIICRIVAFVSPWRIVATTKNRAVLSTGGESAHTARLCASRCNEQIFLIPTC
ncbi:hypothetical protein RHMOL_Rhmol06G0055500 [Rhododendron molle]|uniref:Uncharacterized protein n=1 Tax=Rhododendron molle TaxID=49168 RepID=A0ACC0N9Z5_RHOML|nr:hypothetical protein RHMOL_Rhmol06G0055500 [Rhododendron molle]